MSDNGQSNPSRSHSQSHMVSTAGGPQGENRDTRIVQSETIKQLNNVVAEYTVQQLGLHPAFRSINAILAENPTLTDEQHAQSIKLYEG